MTQPAQPDPAASAAPPEPSVALAQASAAAQQSGRSWAELKQQAAAGTLRMEPGVAEAAALRCEAMVDTLTGHHRAASQLAAVHGLGASMVGDGLRGTFERKVNGADSSILSVIQQHQQTLSDMAATYRAAGAAFSAQDQDNAGAVGARG